MLREWSHKRSCTRHQLESLLGYLSHAATVTPQGRTFLHSLFSILSRTLQPHHHMHLNRCTRADLAWWNTFLQSWNGKSFLRPWKSRRMHRVLTATRGFKPSWEAISITAKELVPIVIAAFWGSQWTKSRVHFFCDYMALLKSWLLFVRCIILLVLLLLKLSSLIGECCVTAPLLDAGCCATWELKTFTPPD